ncbi:MAG TPA: DUF3857 domain-containing protein [Acidobacteriota bacterium]|nr:DUF3857 domain-containing protein [Acidobacteriota bacterium]
MKRIIILTLLAAALFLPALAQAAAEVIEEHVTFKIAADGAVQRHVRQKVQVNDAVAFGRWGEWYQIYNPDLEEIRIIRSVTIQADGTAVPTPDNGILDQGVFAVAQAPDFTHLREKMVSHTGLEPGCTVEFEYVIADRRPFRTVVHEPMAGYYPIRRKTVTIEGRLPAPVRTYGPVRGAGRGSFTATDVPPLILDNHFAAAADTPFIYFELRSPLAAARAALAGLDRAGLPDLLAELQLGADALPGEVVTRLRHLLNERLETVALNAERTAYTLRALPAIWRSGYATPLEKAALAAAVLDHYRLEHQVAALAEIADGQPLLDDPGWAVLTADGLVCPAAPAADYKVPVALDGRVLAEPAPTAVELWIDLKESEGGTLEGQARLAVDHPPAAAALARLLPLAGAKASGVETAHATPRRVIQTGTVTAALADNRLTLTDALADYLRLPALVAAAERCTRLSLPAPVRVRMHLTVRTLKTRRWVTAPPQAVANAAGSSRWAWTAGDDRLECAASLDLTATRFERPAMADLQALLAPLLAASHKVAFAEAP